MSLNEAFPGRICLLVAKWDPQTKVDPKILLLDLAGRLQDSVSAISGDNMSEVRYRAVLLGLFIKASRVHQAIRELLQSAFIPEALSLLRVLSETVINLRYISENDQLNRAHRYVDWMILDDEKLGRATKGIQNFKGFFPKDTLDYLRNTSRVIKERWKVRKKGKLDQILEVVQFLVPAVPGSIWSSQIITRCVTNQEKRNETRCVSFPGIAVFMRSVHIKKITIEIE